MTESEPQNAVLKHFTDIPTGWVVSVRGQNAQALEWSKPVWVAKNRVKDAGTNKRVWPALKKCLQK